MSRQREWELIDKREEEKGEGGWEDKAQNLLSRLNYSRAAFQ